MTKLEQAARQALEAFGEIEWSNNSQWQSDRAKTAITALREALEQPSKTNQCGEVCERAKLCAICARGLEPDQASEPVAWQYRFRPTWGDSNASWRPWTPCTKGQAEDCWKTPVLHDWAYEARALYTAPQPASRPLD